MKYFLVITLLFSLVTLQAQDPCLDIEVYAYALSASCTNGVVDDNTAYLQISGIEGGDRYGYSAGNTYTGPDYASATDTTGAVYPIILETNIANPISEEYYTIRVYNGADTCFVDVVATLRVQDCTTGCDCQEFVYLNEPTTGGAVHKFLVNPDATFTEIGSPWFDNVLEGETVNFPHGLGTDLNGFVYVGENPNKGEIRKFDCDGNIFPTTANGGFSIDHGGATNIASLNNTIYANFWNNLTDPSNDNDHITAYDRCDGSGLGNVQLCDEADSLNNFDNSGDWGFYIDPRTEVFYATSNLGDSGAPNYFYAFEANDFDDDPTTCVSRIPLVNLPDSLAGVRGLTTDVLGNVYIVISLDQNIVGAPSYLLKYGPAPNYNYIATSAMDSLDNGIGWNQAIGIVYSEELDLLFVSTRAAADDCIAVFDTDLNYVSQGVPAPGEGDSGKGIAIQSECCPSPNNQTFRLTYCVANLDERIFLSDLVTCDGIICGGEWEPVGAVAGVTFNDCDQSVTIDGDVGCSNFIKKADGTGANNICGAFALNLQLEIIIAPEMTVSANQTVCAGDQPSDLSIATTATSIQWQISTTSCTTGFTDIPDATLATYTPSGLSETTYYRAVINAEGDCSIGICPYESECITLTMDPNCYDVELSKSVDLDLASLDSPVVFTIVIENSGTAPVTGATVQEMLPAGLTYGGVYSATTGTYDGTTWTVGNLAVGQVDSIQITVIVDAEGVIINEAFASINETEIYLTNNEANACVSVPIQVCDDEPIDIDLIAEEGLASYQWYKEGIAITGAISNTYTVTEIGTYTYTSDGVGPTGDCEGELCCPVVIEQVSCCAPIECIPVTLVKLSSNTNDPCDGVIDACGVCNGTGEPMWCQDLDGDGLGNSDVSLSACDQPDGYVSDCTDTDDCLIDGIHAAFAEFSTSSFTILSSGSNIVIETDGLPNHTSPYWSNTTERCLNGPMGNTLCTNSNTTVNHPLFVAPTSTTYAQMAPGNIDDFNGSYSLTVPVSPALASSSSATGLGAIGFAVSGAVIYNDEEGPGIPLDNAVGSLDYTAAHTGPQSYHYHLEPKAWSEDDEALIGIMADGFFLYGRKCNSTGTYPTDLDESGGHTSTTQHSCGEEYHYHIQNELYLDQYYILFPGDYQGTPNNIQ